jgi:hypothetical protein
VADRILRALAADQPSYVHAEHEGALVRFRVAAESAASARATLEDLVACVQSAERSLDLAAPAGPAVSVDEDDE